MTMLISNSEQLEGLYWGYPLLPIDYPHYWVILDPKSKEVKRKQSQNYEFKEFAKIKIKFSARDTSSKVAW